MPAPVLREIVRQHAEMAAFLWTVYDHHLLNPDENPDMDEERLARLVARLDAHLDGLPAAIGAVDEWGARRVVEALAVAFQASLLVRTAPPAVADAFCAGRLGEARGHAFGTLPAGVDGEAIVARVLAA
jgi:hypothetical protein